METAADRSAAVAESPLEGRFSRPRLRSPPAGRRDGPHVATSSRTCLWPACLAAAIGGGRRRPGGIGLLAADLLDDVAGTHAPSGRRRRRARTRSTVRPPPSCGATHQAKRARRRAAVVASRALVGVIIENSRSSAGAQASSRIVTGLLVAVAADLQQDVLADLRQTHLAGQVVGGGHRMAAHLQHQVRRCAGPGMSGLGAIGDDIGHQGPGSCSAGPGSRACPAWIVWIAWRRCSRGRTLPVAISCLPTEAATSAGIPAQSRGADRAAGRGEDGVLFTPTTWPCRSKLGPPGAPRVNRRRRSACS